MFAARSFRFVLSLSVISAVSCRLLHVAHAASYDPTAADYAGNAGQTLYVSKLGNNTNGSSWANAYTSIEAALLAVPSAGGGNRVIVRPDTYKEANLYTAYKGAAGSYNAIVGDVDGLYGSGAKGRVVVDSGDPQGFKSQDWWSTIRANTYGWNGNTDPTFSAIDFDRWIFRDLYVTGSDAGLFFDLTDQSGSQFSVVVEDCVGIGRAFGGGVAYPVTRVGEPSVFRNCYFMSLDTWGDAGAIAIGAFNASKPSEPDVVFENCTAVSPDNAVQVVYPSKDISAKFTDCSLISLNFSQPVGEPSTGTILCDGPASKLYLDLEDTTLVGYKVFGTGSDPNAISYTLAGDVAAYVQFQQAVPDGIQRLSEFPVEILDKLSPPYPAPEPGSLSLLICGLLGASVYTWFNWSTTRNPS